jgi:hypothetical protein
MPGEIYYLDVAHKGLRAFRRISGRDRYVVEQKAASQLATWNTKWEKIQSRSTLLHNKEQKRDEATRRTAEAQEATRAIEDTLVSNLESSSAIDWESLKDQSKFPQRKPDPPTRKKISPSPSLSETQYQPIYSFLVTTADYGPDAYQFAKDKPLTLLNSSNLLHLLEKHGHRVKIDLKEAKLMLKASEHRSAPSLFC